MTRLARPLVTLVALLSLGLVAGCSGGSSESGDPGPAAVSEPEPTQPEQPDPEQPLPGTSACDEVVAGIDAFNAGDLDETVAAFERALPLAEAEDAAAGTQRSADLLEAVEYYAALPAEDYLTASAGSADFARYKAITLGQCASSQPPGGGDDGDDGGVLA